MYSRKLHMRVRRARTSWETSLIILAFSLGERVVNHLARRCEVSTCAMKEMGVCDTHDFALPRQQNHVPSDAISSVPVPVQTAVRRRGG